VKAGLKNIHKSAPQSAGNESKRKVPEKPLKIGRAMYLEREFAATKGFSDFIGECLQRRFHITRTLYQEG